MNLGNISGPNTTVEPPWLREWISPRPREDDNYFDDSGSDGGLEGLVDSSSEEDFGDAHPEDGVELSDHEDDYQSLAEIARKGFESTSLA